MASNRKDVELVIRARDQVTKVFDAITKAAATLSGETEDLAKSGAGVDNVLSRLGEAAGKLNSVFKGLTLKDSLTKQFSAAQAESERLQKSLSDTAAESADLAKEMERAGQSAANLKTRVAEASAAVTKAGQEASKAKTAQTELNRSLTESVAARDKLIKAEARLTTSIDQQPAKIDKARERFNRLSAELAGMVEPTATFQERFEASVRSLAKAEGRMAGLQQELEATKTGIVTTNASIETLTAQLAEAGTQVTRTSERLASTKQEFRDLGAAAKATVSDMKRLSAAQEASASSLAQIEGKVEQAGAAMGELVTEMDRAEGAMASLANEARGPLLKAFSQQQSTLAQINNAYQANRKEIAALSAEMGRVGVPTREMVETFDKLLTASKQISTEYAQQKTALASLRAALREGVTDVDQLDRLYTEFAQTLNGSAAALQRVRSVQAGAATANQQLAASLERAAAASTRQQNAQRGIASANTQAASATDRFSRAVRGLYGESRTAMSWTQRLRGEVLSLIASYAGIYGVVNVLGQVINAYQTLEAATSRLNVVMEGDQDRTAEELDFVRRTAERLGIEFGSLAQEYSKFSIATKGTNLEGANTRKIFVAVAEAARVNKVSMDDMAGTFVALTQIVSKGSVQMEELRQQLGDRLPGAIQIMADGLGVTTAELIKMMEQGQVSSDALVGFAEELERRFGPQLANSLNTVTANMGFLQNTVTATLLAFGQAGFMDSFNELLISLNETMRSSDFLAFSARISRGVASLIDLLTFLVENFRAVAAIMTVIVGIRLIPVISGLASAFMAATFNARLAYASFVAVQAGAASIVPSATAAAGAVGRLGIAVKALTSSTGIGLLLTAVATAFTLWSTSSDNASEALEKHRAVVDRVKNAYDAAGEANQGWADTIDKSTITEARVALEKTMAARNDALDEMFRSLNNGDMFKIVDRVRNIVDGEARTQVDSLAELIRMFADGRIDGQAFKDAVSGIAETANNDLIREMAEAILEGSDAAIDFSTKTDELEAVLRVLNGTATEADEVLLGLRDAAVEATDAFDATKLHEYNGAIREMLDFLPQLKEELQTLDDLAAIDAAYANAQANAQSPRDRVRAGQVRDQAREAVLDAQATAALEDIVKNTGVTVEMFKDIFGSEGYKGVAYNDLAGTAKEAEGTWTIGYGTIMIDGRKVAPGDTITQEKAMQAAVDEMAQIVAFIEAKLKVPVSDKQMQALVSYAYNAGKGSLERDGILQPLNRGDYQGAANAIRNGVATSKGMFMQGLQDRRGREADMFESGMNDPAVIREQIELEDERIQKAEDYRKALQATAEQEQFMIDTAKLDIIERETQRALREAELKAKEAGVTLTAEEIAGIKARTAAQYAEQAQQEAEQQVKEQRAAVEQRVNDLLAQRGELEAQLEIYKEQGDNEAMTRTQEQITAVNEQLMEAIENAKAMWGAIGGTEADTAIAKLNTAGLEAQNLGSTAGQVNEQWQQVGQMFASGLTNAFMKFAQAVANGEDAFEAAKTAFLQFAADFLIKIGEMIIQQAILNAMQGIFGGGGGGGGILGGIFGTGHTGGRVGSSRIGSGNGTRRLNPAIFTSAPRFHEGGFPGMRPGEVPAVLLEGEEVLSKSNPRNALNGGAALGGGGGGGEGGGTKVVNAIDSASFLDAALASKAGEKVIMNFIRANARTVKSAIG